MAEGKEQEERAQETPKRPASTNPQKDQHDECLVQVSVEDDVQDAVTQTLIDELTEENLQEAAAENWFNR